jgi:hypothetical protein
MVTAPPRALVCSVSLGQAMVSRGKTFPFFHSEDYITLMNSLLFCKFGKSLAAAMHMSSVIFFTFTSKTL